MNSILLVFSIFFTLIYLLQRKKEDYKLSIILISRIFIGIIFIYSGIVKAVDPLGYTYKIIDYFVAFGFSPMEDFAFILAIFFSTAEFILGFGLIVGLYLRKYLYLVILFMLVFTPLTLVLAITNPVSDCGCFGDALVITNWQTFWKNIVIDVPVLILFINRSRMKDSFSSNKAVIINTLALLSIVYVSIYSFQHLPIFDFRPYKIGLNIKEGMQMPEGEEGDLFKSTFLYKNTETQEIQEFDEEELDKPLSNEDLWEFVDTKTIKIKEGYHPPIHDFSIVNNRLGDITNEVLSDSNYTFILVSYNLSKANFNAFKVFEELSKNISDARFLVLTAALDDQIKSMKDSLFQAPSFVTEKEKQTKIVYMYEFEGNIVEFEEKDLPNDEDAYVFIGTEEIEMELGVEENFPFDFFSCDPTTLKTIIRANPGLILIRNGSVIDKWHYNDFPSPKEIEKIIK